MSLDDVGAASGAAETRDGGACETDQTQAGARVAESYLGPFITGKRTSNGWYINFIYTYYSVVVLEKSPCPRGSSRTNLQVLVLVLEPQVLVLVLVLGPQVLKNCQRLRVLQTVRYV